MMSTDGGDPCFPTIIRLKVVERSPSRQMAPTQRLARSACLQHNGLLLLLRAACRALAAQAFRLRIEGRPAEAATQYALALEALGHHSSMRSARADLLSIHGIALNQAGQREKAFDAYESCLALNPTHGQAYNNLAVALQEHGEVDRSIEVYAAALRVGGNIIASIGAA